jgi:hypothetical protein
MVDILGRAAANAGFANRPDVQNPCNKAGARQLCASHSVPSNTRAAVLESHRSSSANYVASLPSSGGHAGIREARTRSRSPTSTPTRSLLCRGLRGGLGGRRGAAGGHTETMRAYPITTGYLTLVAIAMLALALLGRAG